MVRRKAQILVVDDHALVRRALRSFIDGNARFHVCGEAESPREALASIRRKRPDLVLIDLFLNEGDGLTLTRIIRAKYARLPVVMLTLHRAEIFERIARSAGASSYVTKNDASTLLFPVMRRVLARHR
ncbi:MAG: response regulator transcription factor [bacterium]